MTGAVAVNEVVTLSLSCPLRVNEGSSVFGNSGCAMDQGSANQGLSRNGGAGRSSRWCSGGRLCAANCARFASKARQAAATAGPAIDVEILSMIHFLVLLYLHWRDTTLAGSWPAKSNLWNRVKPFLRIRTFQRPHSKLHNSILQVLIARINASKPPL